MWLIPIEGEEWEFSVCARSLRTPASVEPMLCICSHERPTCSRYRPLIQQSLMRSPPCCVVSRVQEGHGATVTALCVLTSSWVVHAVVKLLALFSVLGFD